MLGGLRIKLASSVKPLNAPDDLVWKRWLKPPSNSSSQFSFDFPGLIHLNIFEDWLDPAVTESCEFYIRRVSVLQRKAFDKFLRQQTTKSKHFILVQPKSHRLFFSIPQSRVSDRLFLQNEKSALVFPVFNSKTHIVTTVTKKIELKKHLHSDTVYDTIIPSLIVIENLLPCDFNVTVTNEYYSKWNLNKETGSAFFLPSLDSRIIEKAKLSNYFFDVVSLSNNLLSTAQDTDFINDKRLSAFFFEDTIVSGELVSNPPETYNISLLDNISFASSLFKLKYLTLDTAPDVLQYPQEKMDLSEHLRIYRPYSSGLRIKNNGFQGLPVNSPEKGIISRNLLNPEFNNFLTPGDTFQGMEVLPKTSEMPFLGKDTIQRFPKVKIKSEDPDLLPVLAVPPKIEHDFAENHLNGLYDFQNKGVNLLINNSFALLSDESGLGKTVQAVIALQHLIKKRRIKSTLIICNPSDTGKKRTGLFDGSPEGWLGHLNTWAPELNAVVLNSDNSKRKKEWNIPAHVYIVSYENLLFDEAEEILDYGRMKQFDCIILDNYLSFRLTHYQRDRIFQKLKLRYLWILDNSPIEEFESNIISYFINLIPANFNNANSISSSETLEDFTKRRLVKDFKDELPQRISRNKWFELDEEQKRDYNTVLEQGQLKLYNSIERGNLFVIRPQIFTILHELMQVLNFSSSGNLSAKAQVLLEEVKKIAEHGQKAVIFSQYEKFGLKKLEELFTEHKINFVTYRAGMNNTAMEQICQRFRADKQINIFLADIKAVSKNLNLGDFNQIIHFDQWWNPVSLWLAEDKVCSHNNCHVLAQYFRTTQIIEEKIYERLSEKGLLNKLIIESLSQTALADMITTKEWFELFELKMNSEYVSSEDSEDTEKAFSIIKAISYENIQILINGFLAKAGFSKISIVNSNTSNNILLIEASKIIDSVEEKVLIRIYCNHIVSSEDIMEFLDLLSKQKKYTKGMIINTGEFSRECIRYSAVKINLITLIDANLLSQYLAHFKLI